MTIKDKISEMLENCGMFPTMAEKVMDFVVEWLASIADTPAEQPVFVSPSGDVVDLDLPAELTKPAEKAEEEVVDNFQPISSAQPKNWVGSLNK